MVVWSAFQQQMVCALQNWNGQRPYPPLHSRRTQGFTEDWGIEEEDDEDGGETEKDPNVEDTTTTLNTIPSNPPSRLLLVQFRPAWMEQVALSVAQIDFTVHNSRYPVTERTGPLPYLQSLDKDEDSIPVMVGRKNERGGSGNNKNAIFAYLQKYYPRQAAPLFDTSSDPHKATALESILRDRLIVCLAAARYHAADPWEQVQRPLLTRASLLSWTAYAERLLHRPPQMSLEHAVAIAQQAYACLEHTLDEQYETLLGTATPSYLDCELVDHLLHAVTDVTLGPLVLQCPMLTQYLQRMWKTYLTASPELVAVHRSNVFCEPLWSTTTTTTTTMQFGGDDESALALPLHNDSELPLRDPLATIVSSTPDPLATWRFWTRGAEASKHERENEIWVATVLSGTLISLWWMGWASS